MPTPLPKNATLSDLRLPRAEAERFLRRVLGAMTIQKGGGEVVIRMGTTGTGVAPNYRIETADGQPLVPIDGANHQPWPAGSPFEGSENWSTVSMTYADVQEALSAVLPAKKG